MISQYRTSLSNNYVNNNYHSRTEPAFFIEPISQDDFATLFLHRHLKVIIWNHDSLDALIHFGLLQKLLSSPSNTYNVSYTTSISEKLEQYKIDHFHLPNFLNQFIPDVVKVVKNESQRDTIYLIIGSDNIKIYQKIIEKFPHITFIMDKNTSIPTVLVEKSNVKTMFILNPEIDLPESCFLSINLSSNISLDIYKLGKIGINTINNEGTPYSLEYTDLDSIYQIIMDEMIEHDKSVLEVVTNYSEVDFYQYPFEKHYSVCITYLAKDLYKIQNTSSKYPTPGIYTCHYLNLNQKYLIKIRGYKLFKEGSVNLWIAQAVNNKKQTILLSQENSLCETYRECNVINYIFNNTIGENNFYIGLLFESNMDGGAFIFQSLQVIPL